MPLSIVLHSHMPYVEGFGTWPFGEEWLFEAMASCYLPLLDVLDERISLALTPVLLDQLAAPGVEDRFRTFCRELRPASHALDVEAAASPAEAAELERALQDYLRAADQLDALPDGGLARALEDRPGVLGGPATHPILPLCATREGVDLQLRTGLTAGQRYKGVRPLRNAGGLWLPECAYAPWLDEHLVAHGVGHVVVDLTDVTGEDRRPRDTASGLTLVPLDRPALELVWSRGGYPSGAAYRDYHHRSDRDHHPWAVDGSVYDPDRAQEQLTRDAADLARRLAARVDDGPWSVVAWDTELLGHWWYEGPLFLRAALEALDREGVELIRLDEGVERVEHAAPLEPERLGTTSWGDDRDLSTWDRPGPAGRMAWQARRAELDWVAAGGGASPERAARELLALQSSDWAFLETNQLAGPYPRERAAGHHAAFRQALDAASEPPALRHLAPHATAPDLLP